MAELVLTAEQQAALSSLLDAVDERQEVVMLGVAGSGKTTVLRRLLGVLDQRGQLDQAVILTPTHKARRVIEAGLGLAVRTATVAAALRLKPRINTDSGLVEFRIPTNLDPLQAAAFKTGPLPRVLLVDEASMVSSSASDALAELSRQLGAALVWVGDPAQLPPVSDGKLSPRLTSCPRTCRLETVQRTGTGPVLELSQAVRAARHPKGVWPRRSVSAGDSAITVHADEESWIRSAAELLNSPAWSEDPSLGRVLAWTHRTCARTAARLRELRWGDQAQQWHPGEWLMAVDGLPVEGAALAPPRTAATTELRIEEVGEPVLLSQMLGSVDWKTPARGFARTVEISAQATVCRVVLSDQDGQDYEAWLEPPHTAGEWHQQVRAIRTAVRDHIQNTRERRRALELTADLGSFCPALRPAQVATLHASQGSGFSSVWLAGEIRHAPLESGLRELTYVGVTRTKDHLHVMPWW